MGYPKQMYKEFRTKLIKNSTQEKEAKKEGWVTSPTDKAKAPVKKVAHKKVARK